jgi:signal peptidase I
METSGECLAANGTGLRVKSAILEYGKALLWALALALIIRTCVVQSFKIPSGSMEDTMLVGDYLLVNKFIYGIKVPFTDYRLPMLRAPERGDVIVFKYPQDRSKDFIKRVIGLPGDIIQIKDKKVYVNGALYQNPHEVHKEQLSLPPASGPRDNMATVKVPADSYFVMGDNRDRSYDSRYWGFVKNNDLVGLAIIKYWSWDHDKGHVRWQRIGRPII